MMKKLFIISLVLSFFVLGAVTRASNDKQELVLTAISGTLMFTGGFGLLRFKRRKDAAVYQSIAVRAAAERAVCEQSAEKICQEKKFRLSDTEQQLQNCKPVPPSSSGSSLSPSSAFVKPPSAAVSPSSSVRDYSHSSKPLPQYRSKPKLSVPWPDEKFAAVMDLHDFCVLDVETTGLECTSDHVVQVGIIKVADDQVIDRLNTFVNPGCHIPSRATEIHGITDNDVKDAPTYKQIADRMVSLLDGSTVVGHNVTFDLNFIQQILVERSNPNHTLNMEYVDTWDFANRLRLPVQDYKLQTLLAFYGIDPGEAHTAYDDARATLELFNALRYEYSHKDEIEAQRKAAELEARRQKKEAEKAARAAAFSASPLFEKSFCFTGSFSIDRAALEALAQSVGGVLREKISGRTSYLVKGDVSDLPDWALDRKLHKAEELIEAGKGIQIIDEAEFMRLIADAKNVLSAH